VNFSEQHHSSGQIPGLHDLNREDTFPEHYLSRNLNLANFRVGNSQVKVIGL